MRLLGAVSLALLAAQVIAGDEGGWAGFQPFELTKLVLAAAAAHALALRGQSPLHGWSYDKAAPWLRYLGPLLLLAVASGFALLYLHDFSPLLLLLCWGVVLAWAYLRTHPLPWWRWSGLLLLGALVLLLAAGLRGLRSGRTHCRWIFRRSGFGRGPRRNSTLMPAISYGGRWKRFERAAGKEQSGARPSTGGS